MPDQNLPYTQVGLDPVAQPTNQFHYPEVRKSLAGTQLAQVAQALTQIEPKAQQIVDQLEQNDIQKQQQMGAAVFAARKLQNVDDFRQAVADGLIDYKHTPFAYETVQRLVGQAIGTSGVNQTRSAYQTNAALHVDSIQPYSDFIDQQRQNAVQQADGPLMAASIGQAFDSAKPELIAEHVAIQAQQRDQVLDSALLDNVHQANQGLDHHTTLMANGENIQLPSGTSTPPSLASGSPSGASSTAGSPSVSPAASGTPTVPTGATDDDSAISDTIPPPGGPERAPASPEFQVQQGYSQQALQTAIASHQGELQSLHDQGAMSWPQANDRMVSAIIQDAENSNDPNLAQALAMGIKTQGNNTLWDNVKYQSMIKQSVQDIYARRNNQIKMAADAKAYNTGQVRDQMFADGYKAGDADGWKHGIMSYIDPAKLADPATAEGAQEAISQLRTTYAQMQEDKQTPYQSYDYKQAGIAQAQSLMKPDLKSQQGFEALMTTFTGQGVDPGTIASLRSQNKSMLDEGSGIDDPPTLARLVQSAKNGTLADQEIWDMQKAGKLSLSSAGTVSAMRYQQVPDVDAAVLQMKAELRASIIKNSGFTSTQIMNLNPSTLAEIDSQEGQAEAAMRMQAFPLKVKGGAADSVEGQYDKIGANMIKQFGGAVGGSPGSGDNNLPTKTPVPPLTPASAISSPLAQRDANIKQSLSYIQNPDFVKMLGAPPSSLAPTPMSSTRAWWNSGRLMDWFDVASPSNTPNLKGQSPYDHGVNPWSGANNPIYEKWQAMNTESKRAYLQTQLISARNNLQPTTEDYQHESWYANQLKSLYNRPALLAKEANAPALYQQAIHDYQFGTLSPQLQQRVKDSLHAQYTLSQLDTMLPHDINEAATSPNSWKEVPLYNTPREITMSLDQDMPKFGLDPKNPAQRKMYEDAQLTRVESMRNGQ